MNSGFHQEMFNHFDIRIGGWLEPVDGPDTLVVWRQGLGHPFSQTILEVLDKPIYHELKTGLDQVICETGLQPRQTGLRRTPMHILIKPVECGQAPGHLTRAKTSLLSSPLSPHMPVVGGEILFYTKVDGGWIEGHIQSAGPLTEASALFIPIAL